jgi:hypothetical protein
MHAARNGGGPVFLPWSLPPAAFEPTIEAQRPKEVLIYSGVLAELDRKV